MPSNKSFWKFRTFKYLEIFKTHFPYLQLKIHATIRTYFNTLVRLIVGHSLNYIQNAQKKRINTNYIYQNTKYSWTIQNGQNLNAT